MYVVRDIFRCKPGHSKSVAERFKKSFPLMQKMKGFVSARVLIDYVTSYWTVVLEIEVESLGDFERQMNEYSASPEFREAMKGYMDEVDGGHREIFKIV
jgi:heme-degrading monooxygenase HmoA